MKKLLSGIALLLTPILLYFAVFLAFEPNNYFGLRSETPSGAVFGVVREYRESPTSAVILGDSRLAHIDMDVVRAAWGSDDIANLAFMGARLVEETDVLEWMLEENPDIRTIIYQLSFYTVNRNYTDDRIDSIKKATVNPFLYLTNFSYNLEALQYAGLWAESQIDRLAGREYTPFVLGGGEYETMDPADYVWVDYTVPATGETVQLRKTVAQHLETVDGYLAGWQVNEEEVARLVKTIEQCSEKGIRFVVVLPPVHPALQEYGIDAYGIDKAMQPVLESLAATQAEIYDYEFANPPAYREDMYYDSLHLDYVRGLPVWTEEAFAAIAANG